LGCGVSGLGLQNVRFRVQESGLRALWFRVDGYGFRVKGILFRVFSLRFEVKIYNVKS